MKITDIDKEIKKKIVADRQKDYGDYQYNFTILAELFTLILAPNLKKKTKTIPSRTNHDDTQIV
jgi:hypothetical protein